MLKSASPLSQSLLGSALEGQSMIRPSHGRFRRNMTAGLLLTSLVDAFSILVIFLIMNHSTSQDVVNLGKNITLPQANESQFIQQGITVRVEDGKFVVEEKVVGIGELAAYLKTLNDGADTAKKDGLILVADKQLDFEDLSPVLRAGAHAGFTKYKFAVIRKD